MKRSEVRSVQYLRGIAAILVIYFHTKVYLQPFDWSLPRQFGYVGVDIFFCISGFIMMRTTSLKRDDPKSFLKKRALRIYPLYWVSTLACLLLYAVVPAAFINGTWTWQHLLASLALVADGEAPILQIGWTLVFEMYFYAVFAVALVLQRPATRLIAITVFMVGSVIAGVILQPENRMLQTYTNPFILEFLFGAAVGFWSIGKRSDHAPIGWLCVLVLLAIITIGFGAGRSGEFTRVALFGLPAAAIVYACVAIERQGNMPTSRVLGFLGDASYSLYLAHPFALVACRIVATKLGLAHTALSSLVVVASVTTSVAAGCLVYKLVERPFQRFLRDTYGSAKWRDGDTALA